MIVTANSKKKLRLYAYLAGFCLGLSTALAAYINSSFIEQFVGEDAVGLVYSLAALGSLLASWQASRLIRWFGQRRAIAYLGMANLLALLGVVLFRSSPISVIFVALFSIASFLVAINLDIYLEALSDDRLTGRIRGLFLTFTNLAWLLSPLLASQLTARIGFGAVYLLSFIFLTPLVYLAIAKLEEVLPAETEHLSWQAGWEKLWRAEERDLRRIIVLDFLLNFFYAIMIIYLPLYLHQNIGLTWPQIGLVFTVMLLPFVLLDFFLGELADLRLGEKELLTVGLLIAAGACFLIAPLTGASLALWALVLFLTRVGAATLEVMKEAYLFKKIDGRDANIVFISRNMSPLSYLVAPLIASGFLLFAPLGHLFTLLGAIMLLGLPVALNLKDTK